MNIYTGSGWHIEIVGHEALNRKLRAIGEAWEQAADDGTRGIAEEILVAAQARVPVKSGALRSSGRVEQLERHQYAVVFDTPYARRIELGFHGTDSLGRRYNQAGQPYLRPAYEEKRMVALERTAELIQRATRQAAA
mgnify:CR=1 FL=1